MWTARSSFRTTLRSTRFFRFSACSSPPDWRAGLREMFRVMRPGGTGTVGIWATAGAGPNILLTPLRAALDAHRPSLRFQFVMACARRSTARSARRRGPAPGRADAGRRASRHSLNRPVRDRAAAGVKDYSSLFAAAFASARVHATSAAAFASSQFSREAPLICSKSCRNSASISSKLRPEKVACR